MDLENGYQALQVWNKEAIANVPTSLKVWLGLMAVTFLSSIVFIKKFKGSRIVFVSIFTGLLFTKLIAPKLGIIVLSGLVALTHVILWPFGMFYLIKDRPRWKESKPYKFWSCWTLLIITTSLIFDVRDSFIYLAHIINH